MPCVLSIPLLSGPRPRWGPDAPSPGAPTEGPHPPRLWHPEPAALSLTPCTVALLTHWGSDHPACVAPSPCLPSLLAYFQDAFLFTPAGRLFLEDPDRPIVKHHP